MCGARHIIYRTCTIVGHNALHLYSMLQPERRDISAVTVKKLCDGLDLCVSDFFDSDLFRNLPPEIE